MTIAAKCDFCGKELPLNGRDWNEITLSTMNGFDAHDIKLADICGSCLAKQLAYIYGARKLPPDSIFRGMRGNYEDKLVKDAEDYFKKYAKENGWL